MGRCPWDTFPTTPWLGTVTPFPSFGSLVFRKFVFKDTSMYMEVYTVAVVLGFIVEYPRSYTCFRWRRGGSLHSTRCVPCFCLGLLPGPIHLGTSGWDPRCLLDVALLALGSWRCDNTFGVACLAPASGTCRPLEIARFFPPSSPLPGISLIEVFRWARFRLGACFPRCAEAVCVTLLSSGPWCPGWSCVDALCWSYYLSRV